MWNNQPQRIAVIGREWLAIVVRCEEHLFPIKVDEWKVSRVALLAVDQDEGCAWPEFDPPKNLAESNAFQRVTQ
jgi:hypothetical protein